jgi:hypothetical protein
MTDLGRPLEADQQTVDRIAEVLLANVQLFKWKSAFYSTKIAGETSYRRAKGEMSHWWGGFPEGGIPIEVSSAMVTATHGEVNFRIPKRLPGAFSVVIYRADRPEGIAYAALIEEFAVFEPSYIGLNVIVKYSPSLLVSYDDESRTNCKVEVIAFPLIYG